MSWKRHMWRKKNKKGDEKMDKKDMRKVCATVGCNNTAPKDSAFCKTHKPKAKASTSVVSKANCHTGNVLVFTTPEGIEVYGGGSTRNGGWWRMQPRPDVAIGPQDIVLKKGDKHTMPEGWKVDELVKTDTAIVAIDWPDYGIPTGLGREFWLALVEDIYTRGVKTVSCQCMGGHGRTGVQLAILAHYLLPESQHEWKDAGELIDWVREHMCVHEVEADSQQNYIAEVCDIPVGENKIHSSRSAYSWTGHNTWSYTGGVGWTQSDDRSDDDPFGDGDDEEDDYVIVSSSDSPTESGWDVEYAVCEENGYQLMGRLTLDSDVYECVDCDAVEIHTQGHAPDDMDCLECKAEMVDVTSLLETQADLRMLVAAVDLCKAAVADIEKERLDIKEQEEE